LKAEDLLYALGITNQCQIAVNVEKL